MDFLTSLEKSISKNTFKNAFFIKDKGYTYANFTRIIHSIRTEIKKSIPETEKRIGLVTYDDIYTYASIVALWFEGKAYVPVQANAPVERNQSIWASTNTTVMLSSHKNNPYTQKSICTSELHDNGYNALPIVQPKPADLAYILFTSGSTGKPKGVPISFENLQGLITAIDADPLFQLNEEDKCLQMFELTFDFSLVTLLPPLLAGACLYTIPSDAIKYFYIFKLMQTQGLTVLTMVPSIIHYLKPYFKEINCTSVRYCSFGGGKLYDTIASEWQDCIPNAAIFNYYGPTEFTVYSGYYPYHKTTATKSRNGIITIGKPFYGVDYILVNDQNQEVPQGLEGELCLSGVQITSGYWNDPERNSYSFFNLKKNGEIKRFYKTGDLCIKDKEGDYLYVGRSDFQVKIRGYRVELGEIEHHVRSFLKSEEILVLDITNELSNTEIALYIKETPFNTNALEKHLKEQLPNYMVPTKYFFIDDFPFNSNGKIDRNLLRSQRQIAT